jgi:hypothetical protein
MDRSRKVKYALAGLISLITFAVYLVALQMDLLSGTTIVRYSPVAHVPGVRHTI